MKAQLLISLESKMIYGIASNKGKTHDFKMFKAGVAFFLYFRFKSVAKYMYKLLQSDKTHFTF